MCNRFLKLNLDNDESEFLAKNYPNAFLLLFFIAKRARRISNIPDGLIIGDTIIGSNDFSPALTRQNFRTALEKLVELGYVQIVYNGKKFLQREKSTIKLTIKSNVVNICSSKIWDINSEDDNHQSNQRVTNSQPTGNHKEERIRKNKKEKENKEPLTPFPEKIKFRDHVELSQIEYDSLLEKNGKEFLDSMLDVLDSYKGSSGKQYKSDFHTMKEGGWVSDRVKKESLMSKNISSSQCNVNQQMGKSLESKYFNFHKGWRCTEYRDSKKDQQGILFENQSPYVNPIFIAYSNGRFKEEVTNFLINKSLELV